jgi:hypothetical protein
VRVRTVAVRTVFSNPTMSRKEEERQKGDRAPFRRFEEAV